MLKALAAWLAMLLLAIANGALRDFGYGPGMDPLAAHQLSTLIAAMLFGLVIWCFVRRYPPASRRAALLLGVTWTSLTIAFEVVFFHFVGGRPWSALLADYDLHAGRLWPLLLLWVALAPALLYRRRHGR